MPASIELAQAFLRLNSLKNSYGLGYDFGLHQGAEILILITKRY